ncbi:MAG: terminase TerL endonuclease subunit [Arhodomonas sp.]|nr:terminase TerL endonuclease subunit [Arhodomonas sp.]
MAEDRNASSPDLADPVTEYATAVLAREIVAGPHVRDACARHLRDLKHAGERGWYWDLTRVHYVWAFFREVLRLNGGEYEGLPYDPLPWQLFIIGSLSGWVDEGGWRRFRDAYIETGKGSGKSPLAAGVGLYGLVADHEPRAEIYAAATKKDQAMVLFRDAVAMRDLSPDLTEHVGKSGRGERAWNLSYSNLGSFFRPISADDGQSGPRPHFGLLDEVHEHRNGTAIEMMKAGQKGRRQPLVFMITNSGTDRQSVCRDYHDHAVKVCAGQVEDDRFFGYVCGLDENDDPFHDEACWPKANPSLLYGLPGNNYLRDQVIKARGIPSKESTVRRLNFCEWVEVVSPWISGDVWMSAQDSDFDPARLAGRRCRGGLDLGSTQDLTAHVLLFEPDDEDPYYRLECWFWLPGDALHERADRDRVPYIAWRDAGHLHTTSGRAIDKRFVLQQLAEHTSSYELLDLRYDRWRIEDLIMMADEEGIELPLTGFGQGFKDMAPALDEFERLLIDGKIKHRGNPVMTWCAANAVTAEDPAGNRKIDKKKATGRVDGIVAAVMAAGTGATEETSIGIEVI